MNNNPVVRFASKEAGRLGLDLGVFIGPADCAAPWVTPEFGQQELVWNETRVNQSTGQVSLEKPTSGKPQKPQLKPDEIKVLSADYHDVAILAVPDKEIVKTGDVIDVSSYLNNQGLLQWKAPAGNWTIYRFGYRPTGRNLHGVYYIDHLSTEIFDKHWENTVALLLKEMSPEERIAFYLEDGLKNPPPSLGAGYDYDQCNEDVLLSRLSVKNGLLVLPDGMSYRMLALNPQIPVSVRALKKIKELVEAGATLVGEPSVPVLGLNDDGKEFEKLIGQVWGDGKQSIRKVGKGRVINGNSLREVLISDGIQPDFEYSGVSEKGVVDYIHRKTNNADIYFVASRWQPVEKVEATFRVSDKQPELWNPVTGEISEVKPVTPDAVQLNLLLWELCVFVISN